MQIDYNDMVRVCTLKYKQRICINLETDKKMELNDFKDWLFEMMNGGDTVEDIETDDINDTFMVSMGDGNTFERKCKELSF